MLEILILWHRQLVFPTYLDTKELLKYECIVLSLKILSLLPVWFYMHSLHVYLFMKISTPYTLIILFIEQQNYFCNNTLQGFYENIDEVLVFHILATFPSDTITVVCRHLALYKSWIQWLSNICDCCMSLLLQVISNCLPSFYSLLLFRFFFIRVDASVQLPCMEIVTQV